MRAVLMGAGIAVASAACAPTVNLLNPSMPRFEGQYALGAGGLASASDSLPAETPLRVVSFNVKLADQIDSTIQLLRAGPLRGADVIALQEMDETGTERIARALHLNYIYYPGSIHPTRHRYFGPALLTPWPIVASRKLILPHEGLVRHQRRNATAATILVRGRPVRAYAVHLETQIRASDHDREDQVRPARHHEPGGPAHQDAVARPLAAEPAREHRRRDQHVEQPGQHEAEGQLDPDPAEETTGGLQPAHHELRVPRERDHDRDRGQR